MRNRKRVEKRYSVKVRDFGEYSEPIEGEANSDKKTLNGVWHELNYEKLIIQSDTLLMKNDLLFGIRFVVHGPSRDEAIDLVNTIEYPYPILSGKRMVTSSSFTSNNLTGWQAANMFSFDDELDRIAGVYTFTTSLLGVEILRQSITIK